MLKMRFTEHVLHENSDLLMEFRKEDEKNALLTEQNERQVLFCTVTSRLLHDGRETTRDVGVAL